MLSKAYFIFEFVILSDCYYEDLTGYRRRCITWPYSYTSRIRYSYFDSEEHPRPRTKCRHLAAVQLCVCHPPDIFPSSGRLKNRYFTSGPISPFYLNNLEIIGRGDQYDRGNCLRWGAFHFFDII